MYDIYQQSALGVKKCKVNIIIFLYSVSIPELGNNTTD